MSVLVELEADDATLELVTQRDRLVEKLARQRAHSADLWAWYHGQQDAPAVDRRYVDAYRLLLALAQTPWARLVVDTIAERLHVQGFSAGDGVEVGDAAWSLFERSQMNADEWLVYTEALITGQGFLSVSDVENVGAVIAPESSFEVTSEPFPGARRTVAAALKMYPLDWTGRSWALELYRPEASYAWTAELARAPGSDTSVFPMEGGIEKTSVQWEEAAPFETPNPLGVVPVVPFENRATILGGGVSELEDCVPVLRRIDKLTLDKMVTSEYASFRQRWATGLEVPRDPESGQPVEPFKAAVDRLWVSENSETRFGSFEASDVSTYLKAIDAEIAALAAISRVPAHYLLQSNLANPPSAESLVAAESGLVAKVRERQRRFGEAWERALRIALELDDVTVEGPLAVVWQDAEMRNPAQVADAAVKLQAIGVPQRALWEYVGATPQQLQAWELEAAGQELIAAATTPPPSGG